MSVLTGINVEMLLYIPQPAYDSPFPVGEWRGVSDPSGDASGGSVGAIFSPASAVEAAKYLWALEGYAIRIDSTLVAAIAGLVQVVTAEPFAGVLSNEILAEAYAFMPTAVFPFTALSQQSHSSIRRIHQPRSGLTNSFGLYVDGNLNGIQYHFNAWGYVWHPQARRLAGGPRRP